LRDEVTGPGAANGDEEFPEVLEAVDALKRVAQRKAEIRRRTENREHDAGVKQERGDDECLGLALVDPPACLHGGKYFRPGSPTDRMLHRWTGHGSGAPSC